MKSHRCSATADWVKYRARDARLRRDVAIKVLPEYISSNPKAKQRFEREARTIASLNHLHIAQIFGLEESGKTRCFVMELVDGDTPFDILKMPADEAFNREATAKHRRAQERGIVHCDLKPA